VIRVVWLLITYVKLELRYCSSEEASIFTSYIATLDDLMNPSAGFLMFLIFAFAESTLIFLLLIATCGLAALELFLFGTTRSSGTNIDKISGGVLDECCRHLSFHLVPSSP
jgi:hypothetical protein